MDQFSLHFLLPTLTQAWQLLTHPVQLFDFLYTLKLSQWLVGTGGFFAFAFYFLASVSNDKHLKIYFSASSLSWALYQFALGLFSTCAFSILIALRQYLSSQIQNTKHKFIFAFAFSIFYLLCFFFFSDSSILVFLASFIATWAMLFFKGFYLRISLLCTCLLWLVFSIEHQLVLQTIHGLYSSVTLLAGYLFVWLRQTKVDQSLQT